MIIVSGRIYVRPGRRDAFLAASDSTECARPQELVLITAAELSTPRQSSPADQALGGYLRCQWAARDTTRYEAWWQDCARFHPAFWAAEERIDGYADGGQILRRARS
jgi:hypothetical protein